jgi:hypothetical protein
VLARPPGFTAHQEERVQRAVTTLDTAFSALYRRDEAAYQGAFNRPGRDMVADGLWAARGSVQRFRVSLAQDDPFPTPRFPFEVLVRVDFELTLFSSSPRKSQGIVRLVADGSRQLIESVETTQAAPDMGGLGPPWALPSGGAVPRALAAADYLLKAWAASDRTAFDESFTDAARGSVGRDLWQLREGSTLFKATLVLEDPVRSFGDAAPGSPPGTTVATIRADVERSGADGRVERRTYDLKMISRQMDFQVEGVERITN